MSVIRRILRAAAPAAATRAASTAVIALLLASVLLASPGELRGQDLTLTLDEAVALGLENSADLKAARLALQAAQAQAAAARAAYYPSVSASADWGHNFDPAKSDDMVIPGWGTIPGQYLQASDPVSFSAEVNQPITTFGRTRYGVKLAEEGVKRARAGLEEDTRALVVEIKRAFHGYLLARRVEDVHRQTLEQKQEALDIARERYRGGMVPRFEVLSAESDLESFRPTLIAAENQVRLALLAVKDLLGIDTSREYRVELVGELEPDFRSFDRERLMETALSNNARLREYRLGRQSAAYQVELDRRRRRPVLSGFASYTLQSGYDAQTGENRYFEADAWDGSLTAGLAVQMQLSSLFSWSAEAAQVRKSRLDLEALDVTAGSIRSGIRLSIENLLLRLAEQRATIGSMRTAVDLASSLYESARERYENGLIARSELRTAQVDLNNARLGYYNAVYEQLAVVYDLADAVGVSGFDREE
jgi:outer membrane protein TolC